jgi:hypothetical protein
MKVIQPNCRIQFTADDIEFIVRTLGTKTGDANNLVKLLTEEDTRNLILDDESLFRALLEQRGCLRVSSHLYFYVLVRHALKRSGIDDRDVADYVAEILTEFSRTERARYGFPGQTNPMDYFFEMLAELQNADDQKRFFIRAHIGNYSLFLSGVFPDRIRYRQESRGFPGLPYYEALGRTNFKVASDHRLASRYAVAEIFNILSERFGPTRLALNDLSERLLSLGDPDFSL